MIISLADVGLLKYVNSKSLDTVTCFVDGWVMEEVCSGDGNSMPVFKGRMNA